MPNNGGKLEANMSNSYKKTPFIGIAKTKQGSHSKAKKHVTNQFRLKISQSDDLPQQGSYYKKWRHSWYWRPDDGKCFCNEPQFYRK